MWKKREEEKGGRGVQAEQKESWRESQRRKTLAERKLLERERKELK